MVRALFEKKVDLSHAPAQCMISPNNGRSVFYCIVLYCIVLYCIVLYCIVLYCIVLVLYCIVWYYIILHCIVLCCIVLYCIVLHCIVFYCIILYYNVCCFHITTTTTTRSTWLVKETLMALAWLLIHLDEIHTRVDAPGFSCQNCYGVVGVVLLCCLFVHCGR